VSLLETPAKLLPDVALSLSLALVASSNAPILLLDGDLRVVAASVSFCDAFQLDLAHCAGRPLAELGSGEWNWGPLMSLLKATGAGQADIAAYEMDLTRKDQPVRRLVVNARKLVYGTDQEIRLLVAVTDVTKARLAEASLQQLLQEKTNLLNELQHRVANSLQIIASVLLQSARRVNSDETRRHLHDAHSRVMSVASLQQQLARTGESSVDLKAYFTDLCRSIAASMIHDQNHISLTVQADHSVAPANVSVSLGLIVTELVINSLKHGFPDQRAGAITVDYHANEADWALVVADNGVGMGAKSEPSKPGLGTSIVEAIAQQLHATVTITNGNPGAVVSIEHREVAAEPVLTPI
jgi:two-component sensor histidine kinase